MYRRLQLPVDPRRFARLWVAVLVLITPIPVVAEALVFVQGYLGDERAWHSTGIAAELEAAGWRHGGALSLFPGGVASSKPGVKASKRFYTLALPTEAPLFHQLRYLENYMEYVRRNHPNESLTMVGHSAGGVLARLYLVRQADSGVDALITIASPHLGTGTAELGAMAGQSPLGWVAPLLGADTFNRSQSLFHDLGRERPGSLLFWLNRQPHPRARYIAIIREDDSLLGLGDVIVPSWSQDMNNVYALRGWVHTITVPAGHYLEEADGRVLARILRRLHSS